MKGLTIVKRTNKAEGTIRLRFRLHDGRGVDLYHKFKASLPFLKSDECEKVKGQLSYIIQDMKEERQQSRSRGFHM